MKKILISLLSVFFIIISLSFNASSYSTNQPISSLIDCEALYDSCVGENPYDKKDEMFAHYGYLLACSNSRSFCLSMPQTN